MTPSDSLASGGFSSLEGNAENPVLGVQAWNWTVQEVRDEWDSDMYDTDALSSWAVFTLWKGSVWQSPAFWNAIAVMAFVSLTSALLAYHTPYASVITTSMLLNLGSFLNIFIGFLLGLFMAGSIQRWHDCSKDFMELLDTVRWLQMQLTAFGVARELKDTVIRYGLLSAWLLILNLQQHCVKTLGEGDAESKQEGVETTENITHLWQQLDKIRPNMVSPKERIWLMKYKDAYSLIWTWAASLVGRMARDGDIPPMTSPEYGRMLDIVKTAYASIRKIRSSYLLKAPFIYVHTLSMLVNLNNFINSTLFGLLLAKMMPHFTRDAAKLREGRVSEVRVSDACTTIWVAFCLNVVAPALYLTLFDASTCMSQPFKFKDSKIPLIRLIRACEEDLRSADLVGEEPPLWEKPCFKVQK